MEPTNGQEELECFVIMPISDPDAYEAGHFQRVYDHLIVPACREAGFNPSRADRVKKTNHIVIDVLKRIIRSDMVLCDLSSKNPNVLYELGIRQAFNLPVTIIKDKSTTRVFDIQGLRDVEYDDSLRIDNTEDSISEISNVIKNNYDTEEGEVNSLIQLLSMQPAQIPQSEEISGETSLLFESISEIYERMSSLEEKILAGPRHSRRVAPVRKYDNFDVGDKVEHSKFGIGVIMDMDNRGTEKETALVDFEGDGIRKLKVKYARMRLAEDEI